VKNEGHFTKPLERTLKRMQMGKQNPNNLNHKRTHGSIHIDGHAPADHGEAHKSEHTRLKGGFDAKSLAGMATRAASGAMSEVGSEVSKVRKAASDVGGIVSRGAAAMKSAATGSFFDDK